MEGKATALKQEALQHLFIALASSDCRELWTLLVTFFGKGADVDPFKFLDAAPAIKQPLDLADTDSDEAASVASLATSVASTAPESSSTTFATPSTGARKDSYESCIFTGGNKHKNVIAETQFERSILTKLTYWKEGPTQELPSLHCFHCLCQKKKNTIVYT